MVKEWRVCHLQDGLGIPFWVRKGSAGVAIPEGIKIGDTGVAALTAPHRNSHRWPARITSLSLNRDAAHCNGSNRSVIVFLTRARTARDQFAALENHNNIWVFALSQTPSLRDLDSELPLCSWRLCSRGVWRVGRYSVNPFAILFAVGGTNFSLRWLGGR